MTRSILLSSLTGISNFEFVPSIPLPSPSLSFFQYFFSISAEVFFFTCLSLPAFSFPLSVFLSVLFVRPSAYRHHSTCPPTTAPLFLLLYLNYYSIDHSHRSPSISSTFSLHKFFFTTSFPLPPSSTPPFSSFSYLLYSTLFLPLYSILSYILLSLILSPPLPFPSSFNSSYTLSSIFHSIIPSQSHPVLRTVPM